jgi:hypothetical protein
MGYTEADRFRNITPDIRQVFEEVEGCVYAGSGWMFRVDIWDLKEAGLESTYANPEGPGRVCQFTGSIVLPYDVVTAEVRRIVAADSRGGYGVEWSRDFHAAGLAK